MKKLLIPTLLLALGLMFAPVVTMAQSSSSRSVSQVERQRLISQFVLDLRDITSANLDQSTRSFLISTLLENLTQSLTNAGSSDSDQSGSISNRDYNRVVDAVDDYIRNEENDRNFNIDQVRRRGSGYIVDVELDRYCDAQVELDRDFDIDDYTVECDDDRDNSDNRDDNSDNQYLDDTTRVYSDRIEFRVTFDLEADRDDIYISTDIEDVLEFDIQNDRNRSVADETDLDSSRVYGRLDSSARIENGYYRIEEDETEEITFIITYEAPDDDDYRLQLNELNYNDSRPSSADSTLRFRSGRYVSDYYRLD